VKDFCRFVKKKGTVHRDSFTETGPIARKREDGNSSGSAKLGRRGELKCRRFRVKKMGFIKSYRKEGKRWRTYANLG